MKKSNVVWIIPDGVRVVECNDSLGRFNSFEKLKQDGFIEFKNMYTAAPSTFMSFSSFLTGIYSTKMGYAYGELKSLALQVPTIDKYFKQDGYNIYNFTWHADLKVVLDTFDTHHNVKNKKSFFKGYFNYDYEHFSAIDYIKDITKELKEPFFLLIHIATPSFLNKKNLNDDFDGIFLDLYENVKQNIDFDNSFFIVHSDHGFPTIHPTENPIVHHEKYLTQENIKVPFFIKAPKNSKFDFKTKENRSLIDIVPTLQQFFDFELENYIDGESLFKKREKIVKIDNRFENQPECKTAFIVDSYKYIYDFESDSFESFEINYIFEKKIELDMKIVKFLKEYMKLFNNERKKIIQNWYKRRDKNLYQLLNKDIVFIKFDEDEYIDKFIDDYVKDKIVYNLDNIQKNNKYICILYSYFFEKDENEYIEILENMKLWYKKDEVFFIDSYFNITKVDIKYLVEFFKAKNMIGKRKKQRDSRKDNNAHLKNLDRYYKLWIENNQEFIEKYKKDLL